MSSIRLHSKFGLNPTVPVCFWCGEDTGEVALLGAAYKGEAPSKMIMSYDPCPNCQKLFSQGCFCFEVIQRGDNELALAKDGWGSTVKPSGRMVVIGWEAAKRIFGGSDQWAYIEKQKRAALDLGTFSALFNDAVEKSDA